MESLDDVSLIADDPKYDCNGLSFRIASPAKSKTEVSCVHKIFCDPVHGQIALHPVCVAIIDTPQFQRLRHIKQTGMLDYVFPGATHNRFGHSLGVCYLAGKFLQELQDRQSELLITDKDVLCVQIAGLCHDLGHGPFSHTWDHFIKESNIKRKVKLEWKHEDVSANMLDYLIEENNLAPMLCKYHIGPDEISLVKDYITGAKPKDDERAFLHQIVNNNDSGLDVDKWDYFLRDCLYTGLRCSFEYDRLIRYARVFKVNGRTEICFRDKVLDSVCDVFRTRSNLHRLAYQHRIITIADKMFVDAFLLADSKLTGPSGEVLELWEWSMSAALRQGEHLRQALKNFCKLTDYYILNCLKYSTNPLLQPAISLINAIEIRSNDESGFYQHITLKVLPFLCDENEVLDSICKFLPTANNEVLEVTANDHQLNGMRIVPVVNDDVCVCVGAIHWGKHWKNPVQFVHFYSKNFPFTLSTMEHLDVSAILPKTFEEIQVNVLCRRRDSYAIQVVRHLFEKYWEYIKVKEISHLQSRE